MRRFTTSIHRSHLALLVLAGAAGLAACSGQIDVTPSASGTSTGAGGGASSATSGPTSTSATSTTSSSTGAGGSGGSIGPLTCLPGEGAIVAGIANHHSAVAVLSQRAWTGAQSIVPAAVETAAYVDVYHRLAVFWTEHKGGVDHAHFTHTTDGAAFATHEVQTWHPKSGSPLFRAGDGTLVGSVAQGTGLAYYHSDTMDFHAWQSTSTPFPVTSAAMLTTPGSAVLVGFSYECELCDVTLDGATSTWGAAKCHPEIPVWLGNEIPSPPPQLVALPSGDAVAVYFTSYIDLTAVVLHDGQWSAPVTTKLPEQSLSFAVTSTPAGDVIAGVVLTSGDVAALRFSPAAGWAAPIAVDTGASIIQRPAAATGICGDDALFAYSAGELDGEVRVARVRGDAAETTKIAKLVEDVPFALSLATRRATQSL